MSRIVEPGSTRVEKPCIKQFITLLLCFLNHHMEHVGGEQDEILSPSLGLTPFDGKAGWSPAAMAAEA